MEDRVDRELWLEASAQDVWDAVTDDGWLAPEAYLELRPGGDAWFRGPGGERIGWVEEAVTPGAEGSEGRLAFCWAADGEPASRVEITIAEHDERTRLRVTEARPLEVLDLVGLPLPRTGGTSYGPALAVR